MLDPSSASAPVVLLAAGRSSRMGQPKGLVPFEGRPWIESQIEWLGSRRVVVVLGHDHRRYHEAVASLAHPNGSLRVEINPDPDRGPFSSLQVGLAAVARAPGTPAFVLPIDVPAASTPVWASLEQALCPRIDAVVPLFEGRGGHPVLLATAFVALLLTRDPTSADARLDRELAMARVARIPVEDPRIRLNLNAPEDWGKLGRGL